MSIAADQISYDLSLVDHLGGEREHFLTQEVGRIPGQGSGWDRSPAIPGIVYFRPRAAEFLKGMSEAWTCELPACQVEFRTKPHATLLGLGLELLCGLWQGMRRAARLGLSLGCQEVAPESMPMDVFPKPRYHAIAQHLTPERLHAACRVTGVHIHYGCRDLSHAIRVHNALLQHLHRFVAMGDHSGGERMRLYHVVTQGKSYSSEYRDEDHFFEVARAEGFFEDLSSCWHLIRITVHGTVEVRLGNMGVFQTLRVAHLIRKIARSC